MKSILLVSHFLCCKESLGPWLMQSRNLTLLAYVAAITDLLSISCHFHRPVSLQGKDFPEEQTKKKQLA